MQVAIVHDYIKEYGGAERVLEALHEIWPEAPVYTSIYLPDNLGPHRQRFKDWNIIPSFFQLIPFKSKIVSPMRIFSSIIFESWDFSKYDLVIVSATGAYNPNLINKKTGSLHICYCHTPPRYLYGYPTARNWRKTFFGRLMGEIINHRLRQTDYTSSQKPDFFIANSNEVKARIRKFYRREATVIYPPAGNGYIESTAGSPNKTDEIPASPAGRRNPEFQNEFFLTGGRLARVKHIDLEIQAANQLKLHLKIFGKAFAGYENELKKTAGPTVEFTGEVDEAGLALLYRNCRALLYPSEYEDFGIIPVEAQAFGKPVIAYRKSGVTESVVEDKTGVFFNELTAGSLISAINKLKNINISEKDCIKNAQKFNKERFKKEITDFIKGKMKDA